MGLSRKRTPISLRALTYAALSVVQASEGDIGARAGARGRSSPNGPIRALTGAQGQNPPPPPPFGPPPPPPWAPRRAPPAPSGPFFKRGGRLGGGGGRSGTIPGKGNKGEIAAPGLADERPRRAPAPPP